jgi:hypothetical protein
MAEKLVKIIARNPKWLLRVREGNLLADCLAFAGACKPVGQVAWSYYTAPKDEEVRGGVEFDPQAFPAFGGIQRG